MNSMKARLHLLTYIINPEMQEGAVIDRVRLQTKSTTVKHRGFSRAEAVNNPIISLQSVALPPNNIGLGGGGGGGGGVLGAANTMCITGFFSNS